MLYICFTKIKVKHFALHCQALFNKTDGFKFMKSDNLYDVMTNESAGKEKEDDEVILNIRVQREVREQFRLAAKLKGSSMSGLLHQFVIKTIREEKSLDPEAFTRVQKPTKKNSALTFLNKIESSEKTEEPEDDMPSMTLEELQEWREQRAKDKEKKKK